MTRLMFTRSFSRFDVLVQAVSIPCMVSGHWVIAIAVCVVGSLLSVEGERRLDRAA